MIEYYTEGLLFYMNNLVLMLLNTASFTICTVNDKKTVSDGGLSGNEFTFLVSAATALFMLPCMPFVGFFAKPCIQTLIICLLLVLDKLGEFYTAALSLSVLSAFEVKAWLGLALFLSYGSDCLFFEQSPSLSKLACLPLACIGLALIASGSGGDKRADKKSLKKIIPVLILYIFSKYAYGLIMRMGESCISKNTGLFISMIALTLIMLPAVYPKKVSDSSIISRIYSTRKRPCGESEFKRVLLIVFLTRIPNIVGLLAETALIGRSLTLYSFVQPLILVTLFFISVIKREHFTSKNLAGSILCIAAVTGFQIL